MVPRYKITKFYSIAQTLSPSNALELPLFTTIIANQRVTHPLHTGTHKLDTPAQKTGRGYLHIKNRGSAPQDHFFTTFTAGWQSGATT